MGILLPYVVEANYSLAEKEYDIVKSIFERNLHKSFVTLSEAINSFYEEIGFDRFSIRDKVDQTTFCIDFKEIISESYNGDLEGNPREMTDDIIGDILNKVFGVI